MLPNGLNYLNSWVDKSRNTCFQLMGTEEEMLFEKWATRWSNLVDFDIFRIG